MSFSVRIGPRGVSVRTGLGLTLRLNTLSQRLAVSERKQAILHIRDELEKFDEISEDFEIKCDHANMWNGRRIDYPSEDYDICKDEIESLVAAGHEIEDYLRQLATLASEHRTGLTTSLRKAMSGLKQPLSEAERFLSQLNALAAQATPPLLSEAPPSTLGGIRFACYQCYHQVDATAADRGKTVSCPSCGCALLVP